ncbi:MAG TPA: hypothetical protein VE860_15105 [Chthoniobacterales bacterium]|nr:hypothetical protein [Chthoniobacterales bacterium]
MKESKRYENMLKEQKEREEVDKRVENGDLTEEEALEINLKATLKSFERLIDDFEAVDPEVQRQLQSRSSAFRVLDVAGRREMRRRLASELAQVEGIAARLAKT